MEEVKICGVYKITSPSGKIYIGESVNIHRRFSTYRGVLCKRQPKLYSSLKKYGVENHTFEIVEECEISELKCRERFWQDFYDVIGENGLNLMLTECGDEKQMHSSETIQKISDSNKGKVFTEQHKEKLRGRTGEKHHWWGKKHTEETKKKMSENSPIRGLKTEECPNYGRKWTEEEREKHRIRKETTVHPCLGVKLSEEHKEKLSNSSYKSKIVLDTATGVFYKSATEAALYYPQYSLGHLRNMLGGSRTNYTTLIYC